VGLAAKCTKEQSVSRAKRVPGGADITDHNEAEAILIAVAGRTS